MPRFWKPPAWRFVVTNLQSATLTFFDRLALEVQIDIELNTPRRVEGTVPSANPEVNILHTDGDPFLAEGNRLMYAFRREGGTPPWKVRAAGPILRVRDEGQPGLAMSRFTMFDPWAVLYSRPCVNENGDRATEEGLNFLDGQAPGGGNWQVGQIALTLLKWTIDEHGPVGIDAGDGSRIGDGPMYTDWSGTAEFDGFLAETDEMEWNVQRGKSVGEVWEDLCATEKMDIHVSPIYDPGTRPGYTADLSVYSQPASIGQPGGKNMSDPIFSWDRPPRTLSAISRQIDGQQRANKIVFMTRYGDVESAIKTDAASVTKYGEYWYEQAFPDMELSTDQVARWAEAQLSIRSRGIREVIPIPNPQQPPLLFTEYAVGDFVPVYSSRRLREPLPMADAAGDPYQRVFGVTLEITGREGTERLTEIRVSADGLV